MLSNKEYKVLCIIKQIGEEDTSTYSSEFIFKNKFESKITPLNIQEYELKEIMRNLDRQEYTHTLFNTDTKEIYGTEITDCGLVAIKNYKKELGKYIFNRYIWVVFTIVLTALLTGYFTSFFTR